DDAAEAGRQRLSGAGEHGGGDDALERLGRADVVGAAAVAGHDDAVGLQGGFQQQQGAVGGDGLAGGEGDGAGQRRVHDVVHVQQVAQHDVDDLGGGCALELEAGGGALGGGVDVDGRRR